MRRLDGAARRGALRRRHLKFLCDSVAHSVNAVLASVVCEELR